MTPGSAAHIPITSTGKEAYRITFFTDGRELRLTRYTQPEPELELLVRQMKLVLPPQPPPRITAAALKETPASADV